MANKYCLEDLIRIKIESALMSTYTNIPAIVNSYSADTQTVNVKVAVETPTFYGDNISPCDLEEVPVIFPSGSDWVMAGELVEGDAVMLVVPHYGINEYLEGSKSKVASPLSVRRHNLNEAVAIPGMITLKSKTVKPSLQGKFYIAQGDNNHITMSDSEGITLTSGATVMNLNNGVLTVTSASTVFNGNVEVTGALTSGGIAMNTHTHPYTDNGSPLVTGIAT